MNKKVIIFLTIGVFILFGIILSIKDSPHTYRIPDTPDTKQIIAVMNQAYQILGKASQSFDASEFPSVFIGTEDYELTDHQQEAIAKILGLSIAEVKNTGYLTAMQVQFISKGQGEKLLQAALEKAKAENRKLTAAEFQEIVKANHGQMPPGKAINTNKTVLTFESIEINGDKAIVRYDDGAALQDAIFVKKAGRWFIASIVAIWIHF